MTRVESPNQLLGRILSPMPEEALLGPDLIRRLGLAAGVEIPDEYLESLAASHQDILGAADRLRQLDLAELGPAAVFQMERWD